MIVAGSSVAQIRERGVAYHIGHEDLDPQIVNSTTEFNILSALLEGLEPSQHRGRAPTAAEDLRVAHDVGDRRLAVTALLASTALRLVLAAVFFIMLGYYRFSGLLAVGGLLAALAPAAAAVLCTPLTAVLLGAYVVMQLAYCVSLKHVLVVDLAVVTTGFLMRAMIGGVALGIPLSRWFLITTGFGALFMVSAKRYSEAVQMERAAEAAAAAGRTQRIGATRALLTSYTTGYLRFVWQLAAGVAVLAYCLWAMESGGIEGTGLLPWRQLSMVAFILAILRYAVFADRGTAGEPEDVVLRDRALALIGLAWLAMYGFAVADW